VVYNAAQQRPDILQYINAVKFYNNIIYVSGADCYLSNVCLLMELYVYMNFDTCVFPPAAEHFKSTLK